MKRTKAEFNGGKCIKSQRRIRSNPIVMILVVQILLHFLVGTLRNEACGKGEDVGGPWAMTELESVSPPVHKNNTVRIILHGYESNLQPPLDGTVNQVTPCLV
jgi:hypothetical protein